MKNIKDLEAEINIKEKRIAYWELFGKVPTENDLGIFGEATEVTL